MECSIFKEIAERAKQKKFRCEEHVTKYFPADEIELLIVGESPPIGDTYFYIPVDLRGRYHGLPAKIFRSLFGASNKIDKEQCTIYLEKFQQKNYFLTDIVECPIDVLVSSERAKIIKNEITTFRDRIESLHLSNNCFKLLILPSGTFRILQTKKYIQTWTILENLGFSVIKWGQAEVELKKIASKLNK